MFDVVGLYFNHVVGCEGRELQTPSVKRPRQRRPSVRPVSFLRPFERGYTCDACQSPHLSSSTFPASKPLCPNTLKSCDMDSVAWVTWVTSGRNEFQTRQFGQPLSAISFMASAAQMSVAVTFRTSRPLHRRSSTGRWPAPCRPMAVHDGHLPGFEAGSRNPPLVCWRVFAPCGKHSAISTMIRASHECRSHALVRTLAFWCQFKDQHYPYVESPHTP